MSLFHLFGLITTVYSKVSAQPFNFQVNFRMIREQMGISFLNDLPDFATEHIELDSGKCYAGSVVVRPLDILGGTRLEYHYGIVLGTSVDGRELIIEMTKGRHVNIVTKEEFLVGFPLSAMKLYGFPKDVTRQDVIERAKKYQHDVYSLADLNCKDFAFYCAYLIEPKNRTEDLLKAAVVANELSIEYWRFLTTQGDPNYQRFAGKMLSEREMDKRLLEQKLIKLSEKKTNNKP